MSIISDESQNRKTIEEKESVLARIEQSRFSAYYVVSLLEMVAFRDASAKSLKLTIDSFFQVDHVDFQTTAGNILLIDYETKLVCATSRWCQC